MADHGSDFGGIDDLDANLSIVSGRTCLIQNEARRFNTEPGAMFDDPTYGLAIMALIGEPIEASKLESQAEYQLLQDERVHDADATVTYFDATKTAALICKLEDEDGPFEFTVAVPTAALLNEQV